MCGIAGYSRLPNDPGRSPSLATAVSSLEHRGPDDNGLFEDQNVRAGFKLTICAGLKLTRRYSSVTYYTAVDKSTRLQLVLNSCSG